MITPLAEFFVPGQPATKGSTRSYSYKASKKPCRRPQCLKAGTCLGHVATTSDSDELQGWEGRIYEIARTVWRGKAPLVDVALGGSVTLYFERPKKHFRASGALRPDAPVYAFRKHLDLDKLLRAIWDPFKGIVWSDDSLLCEFQHVSKVWLNPGADHGPGAAVRLWILPAFVKDQPPCPSALSTRLF